MHCYEYELMYLTVKAALVEISCQTAIDRHAIDAHLDREGIDSLAALLDAGPTSVARRMGARALWGTLRAA